MHIRNRLNIATVLRCACLTIALASGPTLAQADNAKAAKFYEDALARYERKDIAGAIIQLKNALQIDKSLLPVQVLLGKALLMNGQAAAAEVAFNEALKLGVNRAEVLVPLGQAMVAQGKQAQMLEQALFSPTGLPPTVQAALLLLRASAQGDLGEGQAALRSIEAARALDERSPDSWIAESQLNLRMRRPVEAMAAAERALALAPGLAEAHYQQGAVLHVRGDERNAQTAYERALKIDARHLEARLARAGIHVDRNHDAEAAADAAEVLRLSPGEPRAVYLQALLSSRAGDMAKTRAKLSEVVNLIDPVPIEFIRYRPQLLMVNGLAHFGLDEPLKAKPYLEAFQRGQPNSPVAKLLAQVYIGENSVDKAIDVLESYLRSVPRDTQAITLLASAHMSQRRYSKATTLLQSALGQQDIPDIRAALGLSLMRGGQNLNARAQLEEAYKKDPRQTAAGMALATLYLREGLTPQAQRIAESLLKQQNSNPTLLNLLGVVKLQARDWQGARTAFEQALKTEPDLLQAKLGLARLEVAQGSFDAAQARLSALLKTNEQDIDAHLEMAQLAERRGKSEEAVRWLQKAVDYAGPRERRPNFALVQLHERRGEAPEMLAAAKVLLAKAPEDSATLGIYGRAQLRNGDRTAARQTLIHAARQIQSDAGALLEIAGLQTAAGDLAGARYSLEKALGFRPDHPPAMAMLASLELQDGDKLRGEARARKVLQLEPKRAASHTLMAEVMLAKGDTSAAVDSLRRAHELEPSSGSVQRLMRVLEPRDRKAAGSLAEQWLKNHPKDIAVQRALADGHARHGDYPAARQAYEKLLRQLPGNVEISNNLANVLLRIEPAMALKISEQTLSAAPNNVAVIDTAGWANHLNGQHERALRLLRDARLRAPESPDVRYHLAAALLKAGRPAEARAELESAIQINPNFESATEARKLLQTLK
ncbi:XrtA/PEP-CTERM system TPR-repeat protein PrsT [Paucibacter sp. XJ19-41]|uniref:XrtA/PEP-CTERM system TPR-repeat protein PrsT n=1 Tax=Paucibacter sp. XJ19-41 TaxID=2927824 RepID=UPI0023491DFC|nr:XrtA/PEP-CTERM system TPR-repeat protein PrsT [Paucibacter sp. XJ19-41]MDC6168251.1 PEP-CTERM system TPR-repeat protein PrsT [Paucibacter sp. XJ19-41]